MAVYRNIQVSFWTDFKVEEEFTPEDKYFYLYLFTNPHTNLCGCYTLGLKQAANQLGYSKETLERLVERFQYVHELIEYSSKTNEIIIKNWSKYNWTSSSKFLVSLRKEIAEIKDESFKEYLSKKFDSALEKAKTKENIKKDELERLNNIPYLYGMDTTVTVSVINNINNNNINNKINNNNKINSLTKDEELNTCVEKWNDQGNHEVENFTEERKEKLEELIQQFGLPKVIKAIEKIKDSDYLTGKVTSFYITFDWFVEPKNFVKVLEGNYDNHSPTKSKSFESSPTYDDLDEYEKLILSN